LAVEWDDGWVPVTRLCPGEWRNSRISTKTLWSVAHGSLSKWTWRRKRQPGAISLGPALGRPARFGALGQGSIQRGAVGGDGAGRCGHRLRLSRAGRVAQFSNLDKEPTLFPRRCCGKVAPAGQSHCVTPAPLDSLPAVIGIFVADRRQVGQRGGRRRRWTD